MKATGSLLADLWPLFGQGRANRTDRQQAARRASRFRATERTPSASRRPPFGELK